MRGQRKRLNEAIRSRRHRPKQTHLRNRQTDKQPKQIERYNTSRAEGDIDALIQDYTEEDYHLAPSKSRSLDTSDDASCKFASSMLLACLFNDNRRLVARRSHQNHIRSVIREIEERETTLAHALERRTDMFYRLRSAWLDHYGWYEPSEDDYLLHGVSSVFFDSSTGESLITALRSYVAAHEAQYSALYRVLHARGRYTRKSNAKTTRRIYRSPSCGSRETSAPPIQHHIM